MRFLLDTNILIPLGDSQIPLAGSLANFIRLARENGHQLVYHPSSEDDINRDNNPVRRQQTLERLRQYTRLEGLKNCPWNSPALTANDATDNEILYALHCEATHFLITEDRGIHDKARERELIDRVYTIQTAEDLLRRLYERIDVHLPNIEDVPLHSITPFLNSSFFDSLRVAYPLFDKWFRDKARDGRKAWVYWERPDLLGAICIYAHQKNEQVTKERTLTGQALKLCTFKVGDSSRGKKIGELFLKAAFRYATVNRLEHIFIHGDADRQHFLFELLEDFGFVRAGTYEEHDVVYVKDHPLSAPLPLNIDAFTYFRKYYPHFRHDDRVQKFIVPIQPQFHQILFLDYDPAQSILFPSSSTLGNAIKQAYLCHSPLNAMNPGDVVLFYRSSDEKTLTSIGIIEQFKSLTDPNLIVGLVRRRTVYSMKQITEMTSKPTKVMLFRLIKHFSNPISLSWLHRNQIIKGNIQTIRKITHDSFEQIFNHGK